MASTLYYADGRSEVIHPAGATWSLEELQTLVGGYIEIARTHDGRWMVIDEEGKLKDKPINPVATILYQYGNYDPIVGVALVVDTKMELDGPGVMGPDGTEPQSLS